MYSLIGGSEIEKDKWVEVDEMDVLRVAVELGDLIA